MGLKIRGSCSQANWIVLEIADASITTLAEKTTHFSGGMFVIDGEPKTIA